ncbi:MAG: class II fumarate hydratase [Proteobacteria bacterium]|nr:MAG: class II fumarate hydratase [Pseudomonadota bacterium]
MDTRIESDSMGEVTIPSDRYYGAQTQRSINMFKIGHDHFSPEFIHSFALLKKAAALANQELGLLAADKATLIAEVCDEIIAGQFDDHFPLVVWQTGSGTQTHMNLNEVIAHRAQEKAKASGSKIKVDSHDDVNISQSSNDVFSAIMHIVAAQTWKDKLLPSLIALRESFEKKSEKYSAVMKIGRTHMMDATPMTFGQELSGYAAQLEFAQTCIEQALTSMLPLPLGGTAIGTGLNTHVRFAEVVTQKLSKLTGITFTAAENKFALIAAHDPLVHASSALKNLSVSCIKIANDLRLMASGPRAGFGELKLPANEPGSSIMPGKVNPTQVEALTMVAIQVIGNDFAVTFAGSQGQLELNTYKPLIIHNLLHSTELLADAMNSFRTNCVDGMEPDEKKMREHLDRSLMLVTALNPVIGYDQSAKLAKYALDKNLSLREAAKELGSISMEDFDRVVKPETMVGPNMN